MSATPGSPTKPLHDPIAPPERDPPNKPMHDPPGDPTFEPPQPLTEPWAPGHQGGDSEVKAMVCSSPTP
jgi:hypothetical protein